MFTQRSASQWLLWAVESAVSLWFGWLKPVVLFQLLFLTSCLHPLLSARAADPYLIHYDETSPEGNPYLQERNQRIASEQQELFRKKVNIADAVADEVLAAHQAKQERAAISTPPATAVQQLSPKSLLAAVCLLLAGVIAIRRLAPEVFNAINARFNPWAQTSRGASLGVEILAEDETFSEFLAVFRGGGSTEAVEAGAGARPATDSAESNQAHASEHETVVKSDPLEDSLVGASGRIAELRKVFSEITRATDASLRQNILVEFSQKVASFKEAARGPALRPAWLLASALEGLLKQLSKNADEVTASALNTAAGAVDLLESLAIRGVPPNLATEPPVKLLAVDDDPVSRLAISFALKKAFNAPDLAPDGQSAMDLITRHTYDVIFLDVDMPGMDGYELCMKIHENEIHRTKPVVFVTRHGDFNSRAKSTLSGGQDLIAKPFLTFEITVKALTLALRARLQACAANSPVTSQQQTVTAPETDAGVSMESAANSHSEERGFGWALEPASSATNKLMQEPQEHGLESVDRQLRETTSSAVQSAVRSHLDQARLRLLAAQQTTSPTELTGLLGQFYIAIHAFHLEAERAELRNVTHLASALEGMLKKMLEATKRSTPSTLGAATAALDLMEELCVQPESGRQPDLRGTPARILVVDDDPVARRAVSTAVQLAFGRPDNAESGEVALGLVAEKPYDLIFLDVLMPGIDGFVTCSRIHETALNRRTPVVFVTSHDDADARSKAVTAGGCGFIPKPVLASQIKLTALTFIMRARLNESRMVSEPVAEACVQTA